MNRLVLAGLAFVAAASLAQADGLLYQLPDDGASVQFELRITNDKENPRVETVDMRSVGRAGDARWLEFKLPEEESTKTLKVLIPERVLKEGESPMEHVVRAWSKSGDDLPVALSRVRDFWLLIFLAGPLSDITKLESEEIDSPLGRLKCEGLTGRAHVREDDGYEEDLTYQIRRHKDAPFGVVSCRIECRVSRAGEKLDKVTYELKLTGVGKGAESELRGYQ
jgi:hypothetical protein